MGIASVPLIRFIRLEEKVVNFLQADAKKIDTDPSYNLQQVAKKTIDNLLGLDKSKKYLGDMQIQFDGIKLISIEGGSFNTRKTVSSILDNIGRFVEGQMFKTAYFNVKNYDSMTRLLTRYAIKNLIEKNLEENNQFVLFTIDLNKFKELNDRYSHQMGDATLKEFGKICTRIAQKYNGFFSRNGGDEFMGFFVGKTTEEGMSIANEICAEFAKIYAHARVDLPKEQKTVFDIPCTASIGINNSNDISNFTGTVRRPDIFDEDGKLVPDTSEQTELSKRFSICLKMGDLAQKYAKDVPNYIAEYKHEFAIEEEVHPELDEIKVELSTIIRGMNTNEKCKEALTQAIPTLIRSKFDTLRSLEEIKYLLNHINDLSQEKIHDLSDIALSNFRKNFDFIVNEWVGINNNGVPTSE